MREVWSAGAFGKYTPLTSRVQGLGHQPCKLIRISVIAMNLLTKSP